MPLSCRDVDVLIVGSGFGGSLTALLCRQIGLSPLVIDSGAHPRFAIGESTTPLANLVLESLAHRYRLEALLPFTNYASWTQAHPQIGVGLKRGFSYFHHSRGRPYRPSAPHDSELLVAASHGPEDADTHWFRADFDHFLVQQLNAQEIPCLERTELVSLSATTDGWRVGTREANGEPRGEITARFLIDASGPGGALARRLSIPDSTAALHTRSRAIYAHFKGVKPWEPLYRNVGGVSGDHPFPADAAALHHVFDGGWMWVLRFDNGVTSAGFCLANDASTAASPEAEWRALMADLPSVSEQFSDAAVVSPGGRLFSTERMQRCWGTAAGPNWALLPSTAGFVDPLHSTGIAHTLIGIERLMGILEEHWNRSSLKDSLMEYDRLWRLELTFIDQIVAGCYAGFRDFPRMIAMSLFYFATAIWSEVRRRSGQNAPSAFLCADDPDLRAAVERCRVVIRDTRIPTDDVVAEVLRVIEPINLARLGDPARRNLYPYVE